MQATAEDQATALSVPVLHTKSNWHTAPYLTSVGGYLTNDNSSKVTGNPARVAASLSETSLDGSFIQLFGF